MSAIPSGTERRRHRRFPLTTGLMCLHQPSGKEFPIRSIDLSAGGMKITCPPTLPISPGHTLHVDLSQVPRPELLGRNHEPVSSTVVRVDRAAFLSEGQLTIAIRFED